MRPIEEMFFLKGPMGRGLEMKNTGLHVAFCAGTGILAFLDLVAHLLMRNIYTTKECFELIDLQFHKLKDGFEFHLYVAFEETEKAIGLEICEALERVNQKLHL